MQKRPLMWGNPDALEATCFMLIDILENICRETPREFVGHSKAFQTFRHKIYPNCPAACVLSQWLVDKKYGLGLNDLEAAGKVVDFFIGYREYLKSI